jgi:hypothetical protein
MPPTPIPRQPCEYIPTTFIISFLIDWDPLALANGRPAADFVRIRTILNNTLSRQASFLQSATHQQIVPLPIVCGEGVAWVSGELHHPTECDFSQSPSPVDEDNRLETESPICQR